MRLFLQGELSGLSGITIDWSGLLKSPLVMFIPATAGAMFLVWIVTEAASFRLPKKYLPTLALTLGPVVGWAVNRLELLDFGWGANGWGRSVFFGVFAGALAVLAHDRIKRMPPFSWLAERTPTAAPTTGGSGT